MFQQHAVQNAKVRPNVEKQFSTQFFNTKIKFDHF